jgi:integrase/recombinase XerD
MRTLKHLPVNEWPEADREAFRAAYEPGDVFDETAGPGAHLAERTRAWIRFTYRRWLGFLKANYPDDFSMPPAARITPERVRAFIDHLGTEIKPTSVAMTADRLCTAARLIAPTTDWAWLRSIKSRLASRARPEDRFDRLVPPLQTLNFGFELMDAALTLPIDDGKQRESQYRDGLLLALLSLWPIRRRSIAALTVVFMTSVERHRPIWRWMHRRRLAGSQGCSSMRRQRSASGITTLRVRCRRGSALPHILPMRGVGCGC